MRDDVLRTGLLSPDCILVGESEVVSRDLSSGVVGAEQQPLASRQILLH